MEDLALAQFGIERQVSVRCRSYVTALRLAEASDDLLTIPTQLAMGLGGSLDVVRLRLPVKVPPIRVHIFWHANHDLDPSNLWLRNLMRQLVTKRGMRASKASAGRR